VITDSLTVHRADVIDGRACASELTALLRAETDRLRRESIPVGLAVVAVGDHPSATAYERRLHRLARRVDVPCQTVRLPAIVDQHRLHREIEELNTRPDVSGVLVLRPLPPHLDEAAVFRRLHPLKDVESVHPENAGLLALGVPRHVPSTAASAYRLLDRWIDSTGEERADFYHRSLLVVVGRSNNVGKPLMSLGYAREASIESIDVWASRTGRLGRHTRRADVLIVAAGVPGLIRAEHIASDVVVIDVGINQITGPDGRTRLVGDVDEASVAGRARAMTTVPGGVGPVTDVWLLRNTVAAARMLADSSPNGSGATPASASTAVAR
jgi:methylenetetrahydrofolate dehydrogenase (NADP+)/methenyltetrahydrofolate cyclohydrolase